MAVPEFNEIKAPALEFFADGKPRTTKEIFKNLAGRFSLTEQDLGELLPSGTQSRWHNRANWALYDLYRAGLLDRLKKGLYVISELGKKVAAEKPPLIDRDYLMRFPQFVAFVQKSGGAEKPAGNGDPTPAATVVNATVTPEEQMAALARTLKHNLAADLLDQVKRGSELGKAAALPYRGRALLPQRPNTSREEAAIAGKDVHDGGLDGLINEDRLGLDRLYIQAKRWQNSVGRPEIQNFVGALAGQHAHKGIFITTSEFSHGAVEYVKNLPQRVILIDGERLAELMIEHNIGVTCAYTHEIKRIDSDYFEEEG